MTDSYGLPHGAAVNYNSPGFPPWVDELCHQWGIDSSTYPGHQEGDRRDIGAAPNPQGLNRGIDWAGDPDTLLKFAHWLVSIGPPRTPGVYGPEGLEMVIYQHPHTGERVWYPSWVDYSSDFGGHTDHVHTRQSAALIDAAAPQPLSKSDQYAVAIIREGQHRNISPRGIQIALSVALVESNLVMYANSNYPESLTYPHDAVGSDHMSVGLFQQQNFDPWGTLDCRMDPACSAGLFYAQLVRHDYDNTANSPGSYAQAVQGSAFPDRYDQRWDEAVTLYDRLVGTQIEEGFLMALTDAEQRELLDLARQIAAYRRDSRSPFRHLGEHNVDTATGLALNTDGNVHCLLVQSLAKLGDPDALNLLAEVAGLDPSRYPDRVHDKQMAQAVLNDIAQTTTPESAPPSGQTPGVTPAPVIPPTQPPSVPPQPVAVSPAAPTIPPSGGGLASAIHDLDTDVTTARQVLADLTNQLRS